MRGRTVKIIVFVALFALVFSAFAIEGIGAESEAGIFEYISGGVTKTSAKGASFSDVVVAADAGSTIKMKGSYTEESSINGYIATINKALTLDMNGWTFTIRNRYDDPINYGQPRIAIATTAPFTVKNGTIIAGHITSDQKTRAYPFFQFTTNGATLNVENVNSYMSTLFYTWGNSNVKVNITGGEHHSIFSGYGCDGGYLNSRAGAVVKATDARFYIARSSWLLTSLHQNDKLAVKSSVYEFLRCDIVTENNDVNLVKYASEYTTVSFNDCNILGGKITPTHNSGDKNKGIGLIKDKAITFGEGTSWHEDFVYDNKSVIADGFLVGTRGESTSVTFSLASGNLCDGLNISDLREYTYKTAYAVMDPAGAEKVEIRWYDESGNLLLTTDEALGMGITPPALDSYTSENNGWYNIFYDRWSDTPGGEPRQLLIAEEGGAFYLTRGTISAGLEHLKYNLSLMGYVQINIYIPSALPEGISMPSVYRSEADASAGKNEIASGELVKLYGEPYISYVIGSAGATALDEEMSIYIRYTVAYKGENVTLVDKVSLSALGYIKAILKDAEEEKVYPDTAHELVANIVRYSYTLESAAGLAHNSEISSLYEKYVNMLCRPIDNTSDTDFPSPTISLGNLGDYIYSLTFEVGAYQPRFRMVFKRGSGVTDMTLSLEGWYAGRAGEANWREQSFSYNKENGILYYDASGQYVNTSGVVCDASGNAIPGAVADELTGEIAVLYSDNIQVYNIDKDITITLKNQEGAIAEGKYNLNSYYNGIKNALAEQELLLVREFLKSMREYGESVVRYRFAEGKVTEDNMETPVVKYSDFGAVGDGVTNDFFAIKAAHDYANKKGYSVVAEEGAVYYISKTEGATITIMTDTDWCGAEFIIDDTGIAVSSPERTASIFTVAPSNAISTYTPDNNSAIGKALTAINSAGGIDKSSFTKLDLGLGYPALVYLINGNHKCYIRYGVNENAGSAQRELVLIDEEGNVDPSTPLLFDYSEITSIQVVPINEASIRVGNGSIRTIANGAPRQYTYYSRNILVNRSNTTLYGISHTIEGEGDTGAPYSGFITVSNSNNVTIRDSVVSAHKAYKLEGNDKNTMGTYDLSFGNANNVVCYNVTMHNFFAEGTETPSVNAGFWGVMGSNYCKNLTYDSCKLTRFDAHCGTYNATIRNSDVATLTLIGGGLFTIEDSTVYTDTRSYLVGLRSDYGSTWNGEFVIKNVVAKTSSAYSSSSLALINGSFTNWNFGYSCYMPSTVTVDNFKVSAASVKNISLANGTITNEGVSGDTYDGTENLNPYAVTEELIVKNNKAGYIYTLPSAFTETTITKE